MLVFMGGVNTVNDIERQCKSEQYGLVVNSYCKFIIISNIYMNLKIMKGQVEQRSS